MSDMIKREDVQREIQASFDNGAFSWQDGLDLMDRINALPPASPWHRVEEELPNDEQYVLFVVHTPPYHSTEMGDIPDMKKVVYGHFSLSQRRGRRYWSWEDEIGECVIANEFVEEEDGERTYITHWMPLPEPPKEDA